MVPSWRHGLALEARSSKMARPNIATTQIGLPSKIVTDHQQASELYFDCRGPSEAPPIIFCHPLGGTLSVWRELVGMLSERFRCIVFDASGHGETKPRNLPPQIAAMAADIVGLMDSLGIDKAHIVGASIGGMSAQAFASAYPQRVDRLILMATTPKMPEPRMWVDRAAEVRSVGLASVCDAAMKRWFTPAFLASNPSRVEETRQSFLATDFESYAIACEAIADMDFTGALAAISAPTLVMAAADDVSTPPETTEMLRRSVPGATSIIVPDAAHLMMIERSRQVANWISTFLELPLELRQA